MADRAKQAACAAAYSQFPSLKGVQPILEKTGPRRVYVFSAATPGPAGRTLRHVVRVTVDDNGHVVKVTTAR